MTNRADDFDEQGGQGEQTPAHIWLRYATQFTAGERTYTIDIGIPVPLGADAGTREQLLREADAGLDQLADYVERRVMQVARQSGAMPPAPVVPRPAAPAIPTPTPAVAPTPLSLPVSTPAAQTPSSAPISPAAPTSPASRPQVPAASAAPAREAASRSSVSPSPVAQTAQATQGNQPAAPASPGRPGIGASMPSIPGLPGGTLPLPEFLKYLKEMGLDARRAMTLLKVKSLSGLNLRDALEQLQHILMEEGGNPPPARPPTGPQAPTRNPSSSSRSASGESNAAAVAPGPATGGEGNPVAGRPTARTPQATPATPAASANQGSSPPASHAAPASASNRPARSATPPPPLSSAALPARPPSGPAANPAVGSGTRQNASVHEGQASYPPPIVFDEEEDEDELEDLDFEEGDEDEQASSFGASVGLSAAHRDSAENIVSRLRESGGTSAVSPTRLKVLHNVVDGQLQPEQLQALIHGVWGAASEKKLKSEQAEALISWGKQDDFVAEAEMVLALFEEGGDASSNR